jgi:hypothetical protein
MSYQIEKRTHQPESLPIQPLIPLTGAKQLLTIRQDIEKGKIHTGKNFELVLFSYNEIQKHFKRMPRKAGGCRSGCNHQMNKILQNWFKVFDKHGGILPADREQIKQMNDSIKVVKDGQLVSLEDRRKEYEEMSWQELRQLLGEDRCKQIGKDGKMAKKSDIIEELLKL